MLAICYTGEMFAWMEMAMVQRGLFSIGVLGFFALALPFASLAAPGNTDCMASATTQSEMTACANTRYKQADKALNARYETLMQALADRPARQVALRKAQRAWLAYRDADCAFVASANAGGSMAPMVKLQCLADRTTQRSRVLVSEKPQH